MANTLRIKRSVSTNIPTGLAQGELAYSEDDSPNGQGELFIGTASSTVTKITTDILTGTDGTAAQPNSSAQDNDPAQDNQTITTGLGIDGADAGDSGNVTLSLATTELTDVAPATEDQFVFNDNTDELPKKYAASTIALSIFNNDLGAGTQDLASVTGYGASTATESTFSGGLLMSDSDLNRPVLEDYAVKHQTPTVSGNAVAVNLTLGNSVLIDMDPATAAVTLTLTNPPASGRYGEVNIQIVMGTPAYTITWPGSVTWVGGTAPTLTTSDNVVDLVHLFTTDGGTTWYGTFGPAAAPANVVSFTTGTGLIDTGTAADPDVAIDYVGTNNFIDSATDLESTAIASADTIVYHDATDNNVKKGLISDLPFGAGSGDISRVDITAGTGLTGDLNTVTGDHIQTINAVGGTGITANADSLDLDFSELTDMTAGISGTTEFILQNGATESRKTANEIKLEFFDYSTWMLDDDTFATATDTTTASSESIKAYVDSVAASEMTYKGSFDPTGSGTPNLNSIASNVGDMYTVTVAGTYDFTTGADPVLEIGDVLISEVTATPNSNGDNWTVVQNNLSVATETTFGIVEIATQVETDLTTSTLDDRAITPKKLNAWVIDGGTF